MSLMRVCRTLVIWRASSSDRRVTASVNVCFRAIDRLIRDVLTFRLVRRALKKKRAERILGDLAKVIEAQQGKRRRWRRPKKKDEPPKNLPPS